MALKFGRSTVKTEDPPTNIVVKSEKQTPKKSPERIAKEAKYNADLDVYNKSKADQSAAESEYTSSMGKYNENMKTYKESKGGDIPMVPGDWGKSLDKSQLARWNAANEIYSPGGLSSASVRVGKGIDTEGFIKSAEKQQKTERLVGAYLTKYNEPVAPTKRKTTSVSEPVQDWEEEILPMKITSISTTNNPKLRQAKEENLTWDAPKFVKAKGVGVPQTIIKQSGKSGIQGAGKKKNVGGTPGSKIRYNTESRQSMAYFSGNTSIGDKITGKTESELRQLKKETRGEGGRMLKEGRLGDALTIGKDLSTIRKATRYAKKGEVYTASDGSIAEGQESTLKYFTPEKTKRMSQDGKIVRNDGAMAGYRDFKNQEAEKAFRSQADNPANRNRSWDRLQGPSEGSTATSNIYSASNNRSQQKAKFAAANPNATPGQIRRGARDLQKADEEIMKKVGKKQ